MGDKQEHPDFVILTPEKGLLFIEVKDWFITKIKSANKSHIHYETKDGIQPFKNPLEQVRQYTFHTINSLKKIRCFASNKVIMKAALLCRMDLVFI